MRKPRSADALADELGLNRGLAYRLLRALASLGLLEELRDRQFAVTASGEMLRADHPQSLRGVALLREGPEHYAVWKHLPAIVRDGEQNRFVREFGKTAFEYAADTPEYAESFDTGMSSYSTVQTAWVLDAFRERDFSSVGHCVRRVRRPGTSARQSPRPVSASLGYSLRAPRGLRRPSHAVGV